jgi:hypothetical protein
MPPRCCFDYASTTRDRAASNALNFIIAVLLNPSKITSRRLSMLTSPNQQNEKTPPGFFPAAALIYPDSRDQSSG